MSKKQQQKNERTEKRGPPPMFGHRGKQKLAASESEDLKSEVDKQRAADEKAENKI